MAPHHGGDLHQVRDDDDSSDSYHHPVIMFFSVLMLCVCIVAPVSWMLWLMRNDNRGDIVAEEVTHRARPWKRVRVAQQQRATQRPIVQEDGEAAAVVDDGKSRLSNVVETLHKVTESAQLVVISKSRLFWKKILQPFTSIATWPRPRRSQSQSRAGASIDLPIMRQPAWQELASGSVGGTPSTTIGDFSKPISTELDITNMPGSTGHHQTGGSCSQTGQGLLGPLGATTGVEPHKSQAVTTIGLAMG